MNYIDTDINTQNDNKIIWIESPEVIGLVLPIDCEENQEPISYVDCDGCPMESFNDTNILNWIRLNNIDLNSWTGE